MFFVTEEAAARLLTVADAIEAVEQVFRDLASGNAEVFPVVMAAHPASGGAFGVKSGDIGASGLVGVKIGSYWPANRAAGRVAHASTTMLLDPDTGFPKALVAASHLTALRTAASNGVAVRRLARADASCVAILGSGHQAWFELNAIIAVRPITHVLVWNRTVDGAEAFAARVRAELGLSCEAAPLEEAVRRADIVVTVTASRAALFDADLVQPGTHVSAMGSDARGKQELPVELVGRARCFADVVQQSITIGDFEAAHMAGLLDAGSITSIGSVLIGEAEGRTDPREITLYDSSGMALQDLAVAGVVLDLAKEAGMLREIEGFEP